MHRNKSSIIVVISVLLLSCQTFQKRGDVLATLEKGNEGIRIRVTAYQEERSFGQALAGAYYVFEARNSNNRKWKEIMVQRHDDPVPINNEGVKVVNDSVAYVFMGWQYVVTTDGAKTWKPWRNKNLGVKWDRPGEIQDVVLQANGEGEMRIKMSGDDSNLFLFTRDFGINWTERR